MKLWGKLCALILVTLTVCGLLCGWLLSCRFEKGQLKRAQELEMESYRTSCHILERLYLQGIRETSSPEAKALALESLLSQEMFRGYICMDGGQVLQDSSAYKIRYDGQWRENGRFEEPEAVIEEVSGEVVLAIGSRIPWLREDGYLFVVRELTDIRRDTEAFRHQFGGIWMLFMVMAAAVCAVAARLVLRPLERLSMAAGAVGQGDYSVRVPDRRRDETGQLGKAFNQMAWQVEKHVKELTQTGEEKERLLGSLAHELRTPMTAIIGYSDTLLHVNVGEREKEKALFYINSQARYLSRLSAKLMELLAAHQNEAISMKRLRICPVLEQAIELEQRQWPDRGFCLLKTADFQIRGDEDLLVSLFGNLLDNSAKASRPGQEIQVEVETNGTVRIRDLGRGIPAEAAGRIEEPFFQASGGEKEGLGLGLTLCRQIVRRHGASMEIESRQGKGTVVTVRFTVCLQDDEDFEGQDGYNIGKETGKETMG